MVIIIDGYNLLKTIKGSHASVQERSDLMVLLGDYRKHQNHEIIIIFDGGPSSRPTVERQSGITVILAGTRFSADHCIIEYVEGRSGQEMVLITADRELIRQVSIYNVPALDPHTFYHRIHKRVVHSNKPELTKSSIIHDLIKYGDSDAHEDEIMYEALAYMHTFTKDESDTLKHVRKGNKVSKKNKVILTLKNKL